jgi:hypothetical protein
MGLDTTLGNNVLALTNKIVWGTMMLGDDFGEIQSASVKRTADKKEIENGAGNLRAFLLTKARFELSFEVLFDSDVAAPGLMDAIDFPLVAVTGRVLDVTPKWEKGKERLLTIEASYWDSLAAATLYTLNPVTGVYT